MPRQLLSQDPKSRMLPDRTLLKLKTRTPKVKTTRPSSSCRCHLPCHPSLLLFMQRLSLTMHSWRSFVMPTPIVKLPFYTALHAYSNISITFPKTITSYIVCLNRYIIITLFLYHTTHIIAIPSTLHFPNYYYHDSAFSLQYLTIAYIAISL